MKIVLTLIVASIKISNANYITGEIYVYVVSSYHGLQGLVIAGGEGSNKTVEMFVPSTGEVCYIPPLPQHRVQHTLTGRYLCGGGGKWATNCLHFAEGGWQNSPPLEEQREGHVGWEREEGLVLMGGWLSPNTTEVIPTGTDNGGPAFDLIYDTR